MATLQTALQLSSGEFEREFAKAAGVVGKYTQAIEQRGNKSLQRARGEVEALRLEATGHTQAAEALRQKMMVEEQASALAKSTGISQQNALRITQRRIELEKQLATQQMRTSGGGGGGGGGRMILPNLPLTNAEMNRMFVTTEKTNNSLRALRASGKNGSLGFLAVSQAVEDAQYGLKGVLNNIPQAVMGFGGGAGLAGALSLAAVAGFTFYKMALKLAGVDKAKKQADQLTASMNAFTEAQQRNIKATRDRAREIERTNKIEALSLSAGGGALSSVSLDERVDLDFKRQQQAAMRMRQRRDALLEAGGRGGPATLENIRAKYLNEETDAANDLAMAQKRLVDSGKEWEKIWNNLRETGGSLFQRAQAAAVKAEELQRVIDGREQELAAMKAENDGEVGGAKKRGEAAIRARQDAVEELQRALADLRSEEELYNRLREEARSTANASLAELKQRQDSARDEIAVTKERIALNAELAKLEAKRMRADSDASQKRFKEELEVLRAQLVGDTKKLDSLGRQKRIEEEILRLKKEQVNITDAEARKMAISKADAEDALRDKERAKEKQGQRATELQLGQEMQVLRMRAAGKQKEADALEEEFRLRADAIRLAKESGRSEEDTLRFLRQRQALEDQIENNKTKEPRRRRGSIYLKGVDEPSNIRQANRTPMGFTSRLGERAGLRAVAADRAREAKPRDPNAAYRRAAEDYYERNLQQNDELLAIWRNIGVA